MGDRFQKLCALREADLAWPLKGLLWAVIMREDMRTGWTRAGRKRLAKDSGIGLRTAERYLPLLEHLGIVEVTHRWHNTSLRRVNIEKLQEASPDPFSRLRLEGSSSQAAGQASFPRGTRNRTAAPSAVRTRVVPPERHDQTATEGISNRPKGEEESTFKTTMERLSSVKLRLGSGYQSRNRRDDKRLDKLLVLLRQYHPEATVRTFAWAWELVESRAKTPPRSLAFFERSLSGVFQNLEAEVELWLIHTAGHWFVQNDDRMEHLGDLAEMLKQRAAASHVPYNPDLIDRVIEKSLRRFQAERVRQSELIVGRN